MSLFEIEEVEPGRQTQFYGKFRGTVVNNVYPKQMGRIQALVPDVSPLAMTSWAMPCLPFGGLKAGLFTVPLVGAGVWVEFEQGNPDYPIWTGCYWGSSSEVPSGAKNVPPAIAGVTIETPTTNMIQVSDVPGPSGGIQLKTRGGAMISITDVGITLDNGKNAKITMLGNTVNVNNGALTIQ